MLWNICMRFNWHVAVGTKLLGQSMEGAAQDSATYAPPTGPYCPISQRKICPILLIPIWMYTCHGIKIIKKIIFISSASTIDIAD